MVAIFRVDFKQQLTLGAGKLMNSVISKPKIVFKISETMFVGRPVSVKILTAINTSLKYRPAPAILFLVAVNLKI